ncbi:MAG: efflux RND transporter periplasmic adaptor subunit [Nitrospinales bacterium]
MKEIKNLKRPLSEERPSDTGESDSEEEIIFPMKESADSKSQSAGPRRSSRFLKFAGFLLTMGLVYLLGYSTNPDSLQETPKNVEKFASLIIEKSGPITQKITDVIDSQLAQKPKPLPPPEPPGQANAEPDKTPPKKQRKIKYWKAPMTAGYISDKPGKSPMGMDLIPVYEDEGGGDGIRIQANIVQDIGVKTEIAEVKTLKREIRTIGTLTYDERKVTHVHTKYEGWVEKLHVDFTGQEVEEGQLLAEIYSPELVSTQEELLLAMKYNQTLKDNPFTELSQGSKALLESTRRRLELFDVPEHQIEELIRNQKITKTMHIHSPVRGFVIKKHVLQGMYIKPGMSLYTIADLSNIWVQGEIYEYELPWIRMGQETEMQLSYFPGKKFKGKVTFIDPVLDPKTRTVKVRTEFRNPNWQLKPDMYADLIFKSVIARKTVVVPDVAVIHAGEKNIVIVMNKSGGFESRQVVLGRHANNEVQVIQGVKAGEKVVTSSNFLIDSESNLREALNKMQQSKLKTSKPKSTKNTGKTGGSQALPQTGKQKMPAPMDMKGMDMEGMKQ